MLAAIIPILATTLSPPPRAEVTHGPDYAHVLTYDHAGEVAAEIVVWSANDEIRVDALFPDGVFMNTTIADGEVKAVECDDCGSAHAQIAAVMDDIPISEELRASWLKCAGYAVLTIGEIATGHPWLAVPTAVLAACECLEAYDDAEECF